MSEVAENLASEDSAEAPQDAARLQLIRAIGIDVKRLPLGVRAAFEAMAGEVIALRTEHAALKKQLETSELLADRDALCPVFNRRAFERELGREIALAERYGTPLSLIFIDLDRFKLVNDRFGHATGDKVLQHVTQTLLDNVRQTDIVGRLGGDEFGIALTHAEEDHGFAKAKSLEAILSNLTVRDGSEAKLEPVQLGASCGTVEWYRGLSAAALIAQADETMFRSKNEKKRSR